MNRRNLPSPVDFYSRNLNLDLARVRRERGWVEAGLCPFHDDRKPGSFGVHIDYGAFNCFSCGTKGGSIIDFEMRRYGIDFKEAVSRLEAGLF